MKLFHKLFIYSFLIIATNLQAQNNSTDNNQTQNRVDKIFSMFGIDKETQDKLINQTTKFGIDLYDQTKAYSIQGKNIVLEQTLLNGINTIVDTTKIKVEEFDINDTTNVITIKLFLKGEDNIVQLTIDSFDWGISKDDKYIVFENLKVSLNTPWLNYIINNIISRGDGYLKVPKDISLMPLLFSIKPNINSTYIKTTHKVFDIVNYPYNKEFLNIKKFDVKDNNIEADIFIKGSKENLKFKISSYDLLRANKRTLIVLKNVKFTEFNKPWIKSIIKHQDNEIQLTYTDKLFKLLGQ